MPLRSLFKRSQKDSRHGSGNRSVSLSQLLSFRECPSLPNREAQQQSFPNDQANSNNKVEFKDDTPPPDLYPSSNSSAVYDPLIVPVCTKLLTPCYQASERPILISSESPSPVEYKLPTIQTVEAVSAAKVYLEIHYHKLLGWPLAARYKQSMHFNASSSQPPAPAQSESFKVRQSHLQLGRLRVLRAMITRECYTNKYQVIRVLGKGSFGTVRLVRNCIHDYQDRPAPISVGNSPAINIQFCRAERIFAMKVICKADMLVLSQEGHLRAERDFLVAGERSKWIVPLIESFQTTDNLYLVIEYMIGGDFLSLLMRMEMLPEDLTKFYVAEMILCIEELHRMKWIHRDIKPDNFLISASGHLKIADFGLSFDGHWAHSQKYYNETRTSLMHKLNVKVNGDGLDVHQASQTGQTKQIESRPRPDGHHVIDQLNAS